MIKCRRCPDAAQAMGILEDGSVLWLCLRHYRRHIRKALLRGWKLVSPSRN